ncbi:hypothetical protein IED13_15510 [Bosea sp. SSUT16]|uniref:Uncharacterized protein n=1 Tax=Bosea spartocytisi TaxID=2773451 RepID=A0A927E9B9_9HYPH|nr:hypothetical protein [Bosea spartocytisi]MBD3847116.1 hypothetical protein [Bosea spartocytisi]MCT4474188.1 hypothetical protein [Bosea spartocytisi]
MTAFTVSDGTDWIQRLVFGAPTDRWRLDDYDIALQVRSSVGAAVLLDLSTANGKLIITDPVARHLEVNVAWSEIDAIGPGPFVFDVLFSNKTTEVRARSERHNLTITDAITFPEV